MKAFLSALCISSGLSAAAAAVDNSTGLIKDDGWESVAIHCGSCHSLKLVTSNQGDREIWLETIRWMQERQNLWQLDPQTENKILTYLAENYPATAPQRRKPLAPELLPAN
jgi:hypothetical protein